MTDYLNSQEPQLHSWFSFVNSTVWGPAECMAVQEAKSWLAKAEMGLTITEYLDPKVLQTEFFNT